MIISRAVPDRIARALPAQARRRAHSREAPLCETTTTTAKRRRRSNHIRHETGSRSERTVRVVVVVALRHRRSMGNLDESICLLPVAAELAWLPLRLASRRSLLAWLGGKRRRAKIISIFFLSLGICCDAEFAAAAASAADRAAVDRGGEGISSRQQRA